MAITLPTSPTGEQYEDFVVASLKVLGYFTEPRLTLREGGKEVLELDVVATPAGAAGQARELFETKKDAFSFSNVFKLFGQRTYLRIANSCLVGLYPADPLYFPVYEAKGTEMGVRICNYTLESPVESLASPVNGLSPDQRSRAVVAAWYQQIARRLCEAAFFHECKYRAGANFCQLARTYLLNVRASFFEPSPLARAEALYSAYLASPRLSGEAIQSVAQEGQISPQDAWGKVNDTEQWPWIQALMQMETTARLAILKNALDDVAERGALPPPQGVLKIGAVSLAVPLHALPDSFCNGLDFVQRHPHRLKLPYLFQVFAEILGGFVAFRDWEELAMIETLTGIPKAEVVDSVKILDRFFAPEGGTMFYEQGGELLCMKMVPGVVRGGGAFFRRITFGIEDYQTKYPKMGWLISRWHNALYQLLEPFLREGVRPSPPT